MANTYKAFKGILQYKSTDTFTKQAGYIYFVREFKDGKPTGNAEVFFGTRKYGDVNATGLADLQNQITANAGDITTIKTILGEWSTKFQGDISTVANAVVAVSGATTTNTTAIATLNGDAETDGSVAKAVADAKTALVNGATAGYDTLKGLETEIKAVAQSVEDKNVSATGDTYVSASAADNKVTVAATQKTIDAIALAETALQAADKTELNNLITAETKAREEAVALVSSNVTALTEIFETYTGATDDILSKLRTDVNTVSGAVANHVTATTEEIRIAKEGAISVATAYTDSAVSALTTVVNDNTAKLDAILTGTGVTEALDSFIELQAWIESHGTEVSGITSAITANEEAIKANEEAISGLAESKLDVTAHTAYTEATAAILNGLRTDVNTVSGAVADHVTATTEAINTAKESAISVATAYTDSEISALTTVVNTKLDKATHEAYTASTKSVLDTIQESLSSITKNAVTSVVSSGNTVTVTETEGAVNVEVNTLDVETAQANGYIAIENNDGALYGVMYYGGDDIDEE